jgi:N-acetylglucosaminyldiphosphoundecaprenol N-acetyl-beta-D-mannosaminyltransferase
VTIRRANVEGIRVDAGTRREFLDRILELAGEDRTSRVLFANVHMVARALDDPGLRETLEEADLVCPDGMPLVRLLNWSGARTQRCEGMAAFPLLLGLAESAGLPVAFYGSTEAVHGAMLDRIRREHPALRIAHAQAPPFGPSLSVAFEQDLRTLSGSGARLVFVALGCPRQEMWMRAAHGIPGCLLGVGNAFEVHAGFRRRAPLWARALCLEWTFRLAAEPRRLGSRYLGTNLRFLRALPPWILRRR